MGQIYCAFGKAHGPIKFSFSDLQDVAIQTYQNCFDKLKEAFTVTVFLVIFSNAIIMY